MPGIALCLLALAAVPDAPPARSFRNDVLPVLTKSGCNMGACHGTPSGKNGFKLSLRGFDPAADFLQLTREQFGRRTDKHHPKASLVLLKAVGAVPHEGGQRFAPTSVPGEVLTAWLTEGLRDDPADLPAIRKAEVTPASRVLKTPAKWHTLAITGAPGLQMDAMRITRAESPVGRSLTDAVTAPGRAVRDLLGVEVTERPAVHPVGRGKWAVEVANEDELAFWSSEAQATAIDAWPHDSELAVVDGHVLVRVPGLISAGRLDNLVACIDAEFDFFSCHLDFSLRGLARKRGALRPPSSWKRGRRGRP